MTNKRKNHERHIKIWDESKAIMKRRFIPSHYYKDLYQKLQSLCQGSKSVEAYYKEMDIAMIGPMLRRIEMSQWSDF